MTDDSTLVDLCAVDDVDPGTPAQSTIDREAVAIFQLGDSYYVTEDTCTHGPGSLSEGFIEGNEVVCPFHLGRFDITTGEATGAPCHIALKTWDTLVSDGRICAVRR